MARKKRKPILPFLRPGARAPTRPSPTRQFRSWFRKYPALRAAYEEARKRFENANGVCGFGLGRKFSESNGRYGIAPESTGGLCIKVFVEKKKKALPRKERIPSWISVSIEGMPKKTRVLLDVVTVGGKGRRRSVARLQQNRGWPQGSKILAGRRFAFGKKSGHGTSNLTFTNEQIHLGTTGTVIHFRDDSYHGISAGHVFTDACSVSGPRPDGVIALGVRRHEWEAVQNTDFWPENIKTTEWIRDLMLFRVPNAFRPDPEEVTWPDGFLKELATQADIDRAMRAEIPAGFIWVDRQGPRPEAIPVDLEAGSPLLSLPVDCHGVTKWLTYIMTWPLRFMPNEPTTVKGDSGSPVFLWTEDNARCRLLGMHVLEWQGYGYTMDARAFFSEVLKAKLNKDVWFV